MIKREKPIVSGGTKPSSVVPLRNPKNSSDLLYRNKSFKKTYDFKNPVSILEFQKIRRGSLHPTQKPVALFEYLIKTYTNSGDLVLDCCAGSGTTGEACQNTGRDFILIEKEAKYCRIIKDRLNLRKVKVLK